MSHDDVTQIQSHDFREELKEIIAEVMEASPKSEKSFWLTVLASLGGIVVAISFIATYAHLPKDVESINAHVGTHDVQIQSLVSGQAEVRVTQARMEAVANDTNERVKRMEASQDAKQKYER